MIWLSLPLFFSSCYNYKPSSINSPKFEERGELHADVNIGTGFNSSLYYNPLKNIALSFAHYNTWDVTEENSSNGVFGNQEVDSFVNQNKEIVESFKYKNYYNQFAVGSYWSYSPKLYQDLYLGYAKGEGAVNVITHLLFDLRLSPEMMAFQNDFENVFIQSSFKYRIFDDLNISFDSRVNFIEYSNFKYVFETQEQSHPHQDPIKLPEQSEINTFFAGNKQTVYQFGLSLEKSCDKYAFFGQFQLAFSKEDGKNNFEGNFFDVRPLSFFFGVSIPIHQLWRKERSESQN